MSERANDGSGDGSGENLKAGEVLESVARRISAAAAHSGVRVAVAESLTGGAISTHLSAAPESSEWFAGAVVAYEPSVKFEVLGVEPGPVVTAECAEQMARGVAALLGADVAVSVTGVGGPGSEEGHPAGTVYVGVAGHHGSRSRLFHFEGDPLSVVERASEAALRELADELSMHRIPAD